VTAYNSLTTAAGQPASGSLGGYSLTLNNQSGLPVQSQVTNQLGQASFASVPAGIYSLTETPPPGSTFVSMSINGDPAQLQQSFRLQGGGNYEIDVTNQVSAAAASAGSGAGCPSSSILNAAQDRLWEQACPILPSVVSSTAGAGSSSSGTTTPASTTTATSPASTASSSSISVGTLVQVSGTGDGLNVRSSPTTSAGIVTTLSDGMTATVIGGPQTADGYTWWQLDAGGWADGQYLSATPSQPSGS